MRIAIIFTCILTLISSSGCGGTSIGNPEIMPKWPPDRPVMQQPPEVDQDTIDHYKFFLYQPEWDEWGNFNPVNRELVWGAFSAIYFQAVRENDQYVMFSVIWAMGSTGIVEFLPILLEILDAIQVDNRTTILPAIGGMPSDYAVYTLIQNLDHSNSLVRDVTAYALGNFEYYDQFPGTRTYAVKGLMMRLKIEEIRWIRLTLEKAIEKLV